jgi:hypothetical protein
MPPNRKLPDRNHGDQHAREDHLFEMLVTSGVIAPGMPNIYLILIAICGYLGRGRLAAGGKTGLEVALT